MAHPMPRLAGIQESCELRGSSMDVTCHGCGENLNKAVRLEFNFVMCGDCRTQEQEDPNAVFRILNRRFQQHTYGQAAGASQCTICRMSATGSRKLVVDYALCEGCFYGCGCTAEATKWTHSFVRSKGGTGSECDSCGAGCKQAPFFLPDFFLCEICSRGPGVMSSLLASLPCAQRPNPKLFTHLRRTGEGSHLSDASSHCHLCLSKLHHSALSVNYGLCQRCRSHPSGTVRAHFRGLFVRTAPEDMQDKEASYTNRKLLGLGAYGQVFKTKSNYSKQKFARKVVHFTAQSIEVQKWTLSEANPVLSIKHGNIVEGVDVFFDFDRRLNIVTELAAMNLATKIRDFSKQGGSRTGMAWAVLSDITKGVSYLHELDVIHGDIKPTNILLFVDGDITTYKLGDLGIGRLCSRLEGVGTTHGTQAYQAPELLDALVNASQYSDMWSIGCILYETLFSKNPFWGGEEGPVGAYRKMVSASYEMPIGADRKLVSIIKGLLIFDPQRRLRCEQILDMFEQEKKENPVLRGFVSRHMAP